MPARLLQQHVERRAEAARVERRPISLDRRLQPREALVLDVFRNPPVHRRAGRARARRIFERESARIADFVDDRQRLPEIHLGLPREADDEIRGERHVGARFAHALDDAQIIRALVPAIHRRQHAVGTRLHRQMQIGHELWQVAVRGNQARVDVARMAGGVTHARNPGQLGLHRGRR